MTNFLGVLMALFASVAITTSQPEAEPPELAPLRTFLESKGSPLPAEELVKYDNWKMVVALSCAESGYGKFLGGSYNAWGINDYRSGSSRFGRTRNFESWEESIKYASELLYKYDESGLPTPKGMVAQWKAVRPFDHWVFNVSYSLKELDSAIPAEENAA